VVFLQPGAFHIQTLMAKLTRSVLNLNMLLLNNPIGFVWPSPNRTTLLLRSRNLRTNNTLITIRNPRRQGNRPKIEHISVGKCKKGTKWRNNYRNSFSHLILVRSRLNRWTPNVLKVILWNMVVIYLQSCDLSGDNVYDFLGVAIFVKRHCWRRRNTRVLVHCFRFQPPWSPPKIWAVEKRVRTRRGTRKEKQKGHRVSIAVNKGIRAYMDRRCNPKRGNTSAVVSGNRARIPHTTAVV